MLLWGQVSRERNTALIRAVVQQVYRMARVESRVVWATDGLSSWASQILLVFRSRVMTGRRGRPRLLVWAEVHITQVVKRFRRGQVGRVERRLAHGDLFESLRVIRETQGRPGTFNTAFVERLNATLRTWLPALTRRSRHAGNEASLEQSFFWSMAVYNFVRPHPSLTLTERVTQQRILRTPAMALGITTHAWTVEDLLRFRVPSPPATPLHAVL